MVVVDQNGLIHFVNRQAERLFGWRRDQLLGQPVEVLVPERVRDQHPHHRQGYFALPNTRPMAAGLVLTGRRLDGSEFPLDISLSPLDIDGALWVSAAIRDATARKQAESELRAATEQALESNRRLVATVAEMERKRSELVIVTEMGDILQSCLQTDEAYQIITACAARLFPRTCGAVYRPLSTLVELEAVSTWGEDLVAGPVISSEDCWALRRGRPHRTTDGEPQYLCHHARAQAASWTLCLPLLAHGEVLGLLLLERQEGMPIQPYEPSLADSEQLAVNVGEHLSLALANLKLREDLKAQSQRDPLTSLYNRRHMDQVLEQEIARSKRDQVPLSLMLLDIDDFKLVNDQRGHVGGDTCLRSLARVLLRTTRGDDIVCRHGGDEFAVVLPGTSIHTALERAETMRSHIESEIGCTVTIGVGALSEMMPSGYDLIDAVDAVDAGLYEAKNRGKNQVSDAAGNAAPPRRRRQIRPIELNLERGTNLG